MKARIIYHEKETNSTESIEISEATIVQFNTVVFFPNRPFDFLSHRLTSRVRKFYTSRLQYLSTTYKQPLPNHPAQTWEARCHQRATNYNHLGRS